MDAGLLALKLLQSITEILMVDFIENLLHGKLRGCNSIVSGAFMFLDLNRTVVQLLFISKDLGLCKMESTF